jgi:hypothetical protein
MARLESPLYGDEATGTLSRVLAFRRTVNHPSVARLPFITCPPTAAQIAHRQKYRDAVGAWHALTPAEQTAYQSNRPSNLSGLNFFLRCFLSPELAYLGYCIYGEAYYQLAPGPDQPEEGDYDILFPPAVDEFPVLANGQDSPQAWIYNRMKNSLLNIEIYLITYKNNIEGG